jgi:hypothetical protein
MKTAASRFRDRPEAKRRQDLDDIAVLERLRPDRDAAAAARALEPTRSDHPRGPRALIDPPGPLCCPPPACGGTPGQDAGG